MNAPVRDVTPLFAVFTLFTCLALTGCVKGDQPHTRPDHAGGITLSETIAENAPHLLSIPGVLKVEPGNCGVDSCIKVFVDKKTALLASEIPLMLETWQVDVVEASR